MEFLVQNEDPNPRGCVHAEYPNGCRPVDISCECGESFGTFRNCGNDAYRMVILQRHKKECPLENRFEAHLRSFGTYAPWAFEKARELARVGFSIHGG